MDSPPRRESGALLPWEAGKTCHTFILCLYEHLFKNKCSYLLFWANQRNGTNKSSNIHSNKLSFKILWKKQKERENLMIFTNPRQNGASCNRLWRSVFLKGKKKKARITELTPWMFWSKPAHCSTPWKMQNPINTICIEYNKFKH